MKKIIALLLAFVMVLGMVACGGEQNPTTPSTPGESKPAESKPAESKPAESKPTELPTVNLTMWGSEEDQKMLKEMVDAFIEHYKDQAKITVTLGSCSEADAKDQVLNDLEKAPDVFAFAHDQLLSLVNAGALTAIPEQMGKQNVIDRNAAGTVAGATLNGELYAFPMSADNGYFMFYDKSVFTEEDLKSWDSMLAAAQKAGKKVTMDLDNAWYSAGFFFGAGLTATLAADGQTTVCNWYSPKGVAVSKAITALAQHPAFLNDSADNLGTHMRDGTVAAGVNGTWNSATVSEILGDNYGACKLPTFTCDGEQVQTGSFGGYKYVGVSSNSKAPKWAMLLADWITNEENQAKRYNDRKIGPSNNNVAATDAVKSDIALAALLAQAPYSIAQNVGGQFWNVAPAFCAKLADGLVTDYDAELKTAVDGINAPVV